MSDLEKLEFRQWHDDDNNTFHNQGMIYFADCDETGCLSMEKLLKLCSDLAVQEYNSKGLDRETLLGMGFAILVSRVAFRFHKMPKENQKITFDSWEEKPDALQFYRQYEIRDTETGESLITGYSSWLLVDPVARRILPTKKFTLLPQDLTKKGHDCMEPGKIVLPENMELLEKRCVRYSDLDSNGHTTNSRYMAFIMDALPAEWRKKNFTDLRVNYSKEALLGDELGIYAAFGDGKITVVGKTESATSFEAELYWKD